MKKKELRDELFIANKKIDELKKKVQSFEQKEEENKIFKLIEEFEKMRFYCNIEKRINHEWDGFAQITEIITFIRQ